LLTAVADDDEAALATADGALFCGGASTAAGALTADDEEVDAADGAGERRTGGDAHCEETTAGVDAG
jgi:hypothetical protein